CRRHRGGGLAGGRALGRRCGGGGRFGLRPCRRAAFDLLDDHPPGAAMAEALAHPTLLGPPALQAPGLSPGDPQLPFASLFRRFSHSDPNSHAFAPCLAGLSPSVSAGTGAEPARKRRRRAVRARNVSLSGPASRAACITFDRPNAKSNCAEVKTSMTTI